ncbi:hypothetical protein EIN_430810 [Entamoeba invadens IP1]|uniref:RRM domain-containing protein n=1 Tax=Entamoeba invadens IP1 TaxID=370355 RepID=A0A0A1UFA8_ENTIV|nr:hypothetical protein EIN_430810 [Entamoeba invadens IP1]ELP95275.1 hypothetical protein EIN_430810 [Entamoeba invadens IP1]|eukprot:XP_004262046.1 hypothetical protein EIN_430810 [Entamoeba invadens IP1]
MSSEKNTPRNTTNSILRTKSELEGLHEYQYGDHPSRILYICNVPQTSVDSLKSFVTSPDLKKFYDKELRLGFVLISFYDLRVSKKMFKAVQMHFPTFKVSYAIARDVLSDTEQNQGTLVVFNLDASCTNETIKQLFLQYGDVKEIRETPNKRHHKFVEFFDLRDAAKAEAALNHAEFCGKRLKLEPSRPGGIRQRLLSSAVRAIGLQDDLIALPPPEEMIILIDKYLKNKGEVCCKGDEVIVSLPKPTIVGQELSHTFLRETVGTPHIKLEEKKVINCGIGFNEENDVDENKTVIIIENIPLTLTKEELVEVIEKNATCFYDQLFCLHQDKEHYKAVVRLTNKMVVESMMNAFNNVFLEKDQDKCCVVRTSTMQGKVFTSTLTSLLV